MNTRQHMMIIRRYAIITDHGYDDDTFVIIKEEDTDERLQDSFLGVVLLIVVEIYVKNHTNFLFLFLISFCVTVYVLAFLFVHFLLGLL